MADDDQQQEEQKPPQTEEETEIILPKKDWQLALGGSNKASQKADEE